MPYNKNFNPEDVLRLLGVVNEKYSDHSPEDEALRIAGVALEFLRHTNQLDTFREFFEKFYSPDYEMKPSRTFETQEEADEWLEQGTAKNNELVSIAGQGFLAIVRPTRSFFLRSPLLAELRRTQEEK